MSTKEFLDQFSSTQKSVVAIILVFVAGFGLGLQIFQFTTVPEQLQALSQEQQESQDRIDNLQDLISYNTLQIGQLVCLQVADIEETDPRLCPLSR